MMIFWEAGCNSAILMKVNHSIMRGWYQRLFTIWSLYQLIRRKSSTFFLLMLLAPLYVHASEESCNRYWGRASEASKEASSAFDRASWDYAADLYEKAGRLWDDAVYECSGQNRDNARQNAQIQRNNREGALKNLSRQRCQPYVDPANSAFESASSAFRSGDWRRAAELYGDAERLYRHAAQSCSGAGSEQARENAEVAARNRSNALHNIGVNQTNGKIAECKSLEASMASMVVNAKLSEVTDDYRGAVESWKKIGDLHKQMLGAGCQDVAKVDLSQKMAEADAKVVENRCLLQSAELSALVAALPASSSSRNKFSGAVNRIKAGATKVGTACPSRVKESAGAVVQDLPLIQKDFACFQQLANLQAGLGEAPNSCKSSTALEMLRNLSNKTVGASKRPSAAPTTASVEETESMPERETPAAGSVARSAENTGASKVNRSKPVEEGGGDTSNASPLESNDACHSVANGMSVRVRVSGHPQPQPAMVLSVGGGSAEVRVMMGAAAGRKLRVACSAVRR